MRHHDPGKGRAEREGKGGGGRRGGERTREGRRHRRKKRSRRREREREKERERPGREKQSRPFEAHDHIPQTNTLNSLVVVSSKYSRPIFSTR